MKKGLRTGFVLTAALMLATCGLTACGGGSTPEHEHVYQWTQDTAATCERPGSDNGVCTVCGDKTTRDVPALGHRWGDAVEITPADCETDGRSQITCSRCNETVEEVVKALGHDFARYEVVTPATFEAPGLERATCSRCDAIDERVIPRLDVNTPIEYTFRVVRTNGNSISASKMTITVSREDGSFVTEGSPVGGVLTVKLLPQTYVVRVSGTPDGYTAKDSYTVTMSDPTCDIVLTGSPIQGTMPSNTVYRVGSLMYDFTVTTVTGETYTLSEVLKTKKGVILNFWATWCYWCGIEFPAMEELWKEYGDDVLLLAIDEDMTETESDIRTFLATFRDEDGNRVELTFPFASDTPGLYPRFGKESVPLTVVIDSEGFITSIVNGAQSEAQWRSLFEGFTGARTQTAALEAILPVKDEE